MLYQWRGYHHTQGTCVPFQEIIRIQEAEAKALAAIEQARDEADARLGRAREEVRKAAQDTRERAATEVKAMISDAEAEATSGAEEIIAAAEENKRAIIEATEVRLDEAVSLIVREVTGNVQDRMDG